jgi:hypothetical protein
VGVVNEKPQGFIQFEVERVHPDERAVTQVVHRGRLALGVPTGAVRITVVGERGAVVSDLMTRDDFLVWLAHARDVLNDG